MIDYKDNADSGRRSGSDRRAFTDPNYKGAERRVNPDRRAGIGNRRKPRFRVKDLTFVKLQSESHADIGQLLDINNEGLALRYFIDEENAREYSKLGVFLSGGEFIIDQIPFKAVSDIELANEFPCSTITFRRFAVKFDDLTLEQKKKLDYFLENYTLGEA